MTSAQASFAVGDRDCVPGASLRTPRSVLLVPATALFINAVALPNAFQWMTAGLLACTAVIVLFSKPVLTRKQLALYAFWVLPTFAYSIVGAIRGAPTTAIAHAIIVYAVTPLLWVFVISGLLSALKPSELRGAIALFAVMASTSLGLYYTLFLFIGPDAVSFFNASPNVHLEAEYAGAITHVAGSLVFFGAGLFAAPRVVRNLPVRILVLSAVALAVVASGRTAAVLGVGIGVAVGLIGIAQVRQRNRALAIVAGLGASVIVAYVTSFVLNATLGVDAVSTLNRHLEGVLELGGSARQEQVSALLAGAVETNLAGAGHGIGVPYVRNTDFPWRYEAVPFALLFKVGLPGLLVLSFPFVATLVRAVVSSLSRRSTDLDRFFGAAFVASLAAAFTNPYLEAFAFQWMFVAPIVYFIAGLQRVMRNPEA